MGASLLSTSDLSRREIEALLERSAAHERGEGRSYPNAVVGLCFFEDSVRTRVGFEVAAARLGARAISLLATKRSAAMGYAESVDDAVRSVGDWFDAICLRHPDPDLPARLSGKVAAPIINCGNGDDEHPTQALIDLFAIQQQLGRLDDLRIALVGNLLQSRSAHSLVLALSRFEGITIREVAPRDLQLRPSLRDTAFGRGVRFERAAGLDLGDVDVVCVAGLPAGTPDGPDLTLEEQAALRITPAVAALLRPGARILCPLPRLDEIEPEVDDLPQAGYFSQSRRSIAVRMAVLDAVLGSDG